MNFWFLFHCSNFKVTGEAAKRKSEPLNLSIPAKQPTREIQEVKLNATIQFGHLAPGLSPSIIAKHPSPHELKNANELNTNTFDRHLNFESGSTPGQLFLNNSRERSRSRSSETKSVGEDHFKDSGLFPNRGSSKKRKASSSSASSASESTIGEKHSKLRLRSASTDRPESETGETTLPGLIEDIPLITFRSLRSYSRDHPYQYEALDYYAPRRTPGRTSAQRRAAPPWGASTSSTVSTPPTTSSSSSLSKTESKTLAATTTSTYSSGTPRSRLGGIAYHR